MRRTALITVLSAALATAACGDGPGANAPTRSQLAEKWFARAMQSYRAGDAEDASSAIDGALKASPRDPEARLLAARIALAKLDFDEAIRLTEGLQGSEAKGVRGRAFWYAGDIERAADELEEMLEDPSVKDPWARDVSRLARRGHGRHPFAIEGALVAAVEMPGAGSPALVVPCELDGERILALVATSFGEVMIDSTTRKEPAWVNLRFGESFEVKDVPALTHDLSGISRQLGATIKALLGVNILRHMHATIDRGGSQFVVRKSDPPPPPEASKMPIFYARGGAMMMRAKISNEGDGHALLFVDSSAFYPLALDSSRLARSGANVAAFRPEPGTPPEWRTGPLPFFKLGGLDLSQFPAVQGPSLAEYKDSFDVDLGGIAGAGLLSIFRITFADQGRWLWLELDPTVVATVPSAAGEPGAPTGAPAPAPAPNATPTAASPPKAAEPPTKSGPAKPVTESKGAAQ